MFIITLNILKLEEIMYEFLFDKVASLDANQLHENILFMEATLKKEVEKNRDTLSKSSIEYFERVIQYIKSGVNVTLNLNELNAEDIDFNLIYMLLEVQHLIKILRKMLICFLMTKPLLNLMN